MSVIHAPRTPNLDFRTLAFPIGIGLALLVIFLRLWYIQVDRASDLAEQAARIRNTSVDRLAPRGLIYDRNGVLLAGVQSRFVVTAVPSVVKKNPWVMQKVATLLGTDEGKLEVKLKDVGWRPMIPAPIYVGASIEVAARIAEAGQELPGIGVESEPMRFYPNSKLYSHVLGYVWTPNSGDAKHLEKLGVKPAAYVGKQGVEYFYERELMGEKGAEHLEVDAKRRPTRTLSVDSPVPGDAVTLSLDAQLQQIAMEGLGGRKGAVVAIDPETGEILCMVSSPTYDSNLFLNGINSADWKSLNENPDRPLMNRAVAGTYPPGSTFKIVTSLAAYEAGKFDPSWSYFCPGYYTVGKRKLICLSHHGSITYHNALRDSCNTYFAALGVKAGPTAIRKMALECGFYARSGVDASGESRGVIPTENWVRKYRADGRWYTGDTANMAIGQGEVVVTPLQMANLAAMVATQGRQYKPHFVHEIRSPDGTRTPVQPELVHEIHADPAFWAILRSAMLDVVQNGTARRAQVPGFEVAGKTGSAENHHSKVTHGWFMAFAPVEHPKIAICVLVENAGHGGVVAAPIAGAVIKHYLLGKTASARAASKPDTSTVIALASPKSPVAR
jgi:penicillin-binding protein 2